MSHALARLARHRVWPHAHTFVIRLRLALQWLLGAAGLTLAVLADAAPVARGLPIAAGPLSDALIVVLTLLGLIGLARLRGARLLDHRQVEQLRLRALAHPETTRVVATWLELDLPLRERDRHALERALAGLRHAR